MPRIEQTALGVPLATAHDVAALLGVKVQRVRELTMRRQIPFIKIGRTVRYERDAIRQWIDNNTFRPN